jgi:hypothetical protein
MNYFTMLSSSEANGRKKCSLADKVAEKLHACVAAEDGGEVNGGSPSMLGGRGYQWKRLTEERYARWRNLVEEVGDEAPCTAERSSVEELGEGGRAPFSGVREKKEGREDEEDEIEAGERQDPCVSPLDQ